MLEGDTGRGIQLPVNAFERKQRLALTTNFFMRDLVSLEGRGVDSMAVMQTISSRQTNLSPVGVPFDEQVLQESVILFEARCSCSFLMTTAGSPTAALVTYGARSEADCASGSI